MNPIVLVALAIAFWSSSARAGPPLISDDPNTIGQGRVEAILALAGVSENGFVAISAPTVDLTIGLFEGLDLLLVGNPSFVENPNAQWSTSGEFLGGVKWRPIAGRLVTASFTPVIGSNVFSGRNLFLNMPVQVEFGFDAFAVGIDLGYEVVTKAADGWNASVYGTWQATPGLLLEAEIWSRQSSVLSSADVGVQLGFEWSLPAGLSLMAAGGPGLEPKDNERVEWSAYVGIKWAFRAFGTPTPVYD